MNQKRYIISAFLMLFVAAVIYFVIKKLPQGKDVENSPTIIDYEQSEDSLTKTQIDGKKLFQQSCASCHNIFKDMTGPALMSLNERWPDKKKLYQFIRTPFPLLNKDPYLKKLRKKFGGIAHVAFPALADKDIDAILRYINNEETRIGY